MLGLEKHEQLIDDSGKKMASDESMESAVKSSAGPEKTAPQNGLKEQATSMPRQPIQLDSGSQEGQGPGHPVSPVSENQEFRITTGAHSLSSTDSDMAKAIHSANHPPALDSPPDLISPKNNALGDSRQPLLTVED